LGNDQSLGHKRRSEKTYFGATKTRKPNGWPQGNLGGTGYPSDPAPGQNRKLIVVLLGRAGIKTIAGGPSNVPVKGWRKQTGGGLTEGAVEEPARNKDPEHPKRRVRRNPQGGKKPGDRAMQVAKNTGRKTGQSPQRRKKGAKRDTSTSPLPLEKTQKKTRRRGIYKRK